MLMPDIFKLIRRCQPGKKPQRAQGKVKDHGRPRSPRSKGLGKEHVQVLKGLSNTLQPTRVYERFVNHWEHMGRLTILWHKSLREGLLRHQTSHLATQIKQQGPRIETKSESECAQRGWVRQSRQIEGLVHFTMWMRVILTGHPSIRYQMSGWQMTRC